MARPTNLEIILQHRERVRQEQAQHAQAAAARIVNLLPKRLRAKKIDQLNAIILEEFSRSQW